MRIKAEENYIKNFSKLLLLIGACVLLFCTGSIYLISLYFSKVHDNARIVNVSGQQRTLSQQVLKEAYKHQLNNNNYWALEEKLLVWRQNHQQLSSDNSNSRLAKYNTRITDSIYGRISKTQDQIGQLLVDHPKLTKANLEEISRLEAQYLLGMDAIVQEYQKAHEKSLGQFKKIAIGIILYFIAVLYFILLIFVRPLIQKLRKNLEERNIRESRNQAVINNTKDAIWSVDTELNLLTANTSYLKNQAEKGYHLKEGDNIKGLLLFGDSLKDYDAVFKGESLTKKVNLPTEMGYRTFELYFYPIYKEKEIVGCCVRQADITQIQETFKRLERGKEELKEAQQIADFGNWYWNIKEDEIYISEHLNNIFGIPLERRKNYLTYPTLMNLIHPDDREAYDISLKNSLKESVPHDIVYRIEIGGQLKFIHQKGRTFEGNDDGHLRMAGTAQDVTKTIIANQKIENQNKELENFIYILSHNLKRPIANILALQGLYEEGDNPINDGIIANIKSCCEALNTTIKDLNLSLSLKEISKEDFTPVDICEILDDIQVLLNKDIIESKAKIYTKITQDKIMGIKSYFVNIFYNLVLNSLKYRNPEVPLIIKINVFQNREQIVIRIEDNGIGMRLTPERKKKIFDMYGRLSGKSEGKGLGLYLVKTQVEAMFGKIDVESELNIGTTMILHFKTGINENIEEEDLNHVYLGN
ncbi:ATP-binding protein [Croceivirga sp. JEA036]|uniref:ATP-binding protein n=1 Tax=Croceivirga sp. JEA036 TaxID=2721162 RepID=UPI00143B76B8|nr:ATP-binding protein [Croceivirga sp. JEA036]NJB37994.1 PAS domain-containing protein [Croceivirga sp. JEA036]